MFHSNLYNVSARSIRRIVVAMLMMMLLMVMVSIASADGVYHTEHADFYPVGNWPLQSGFIENIHPNGPQMYAIERYVLNGATPNAEFYIHPLVYLENADCTDGLIPFPVDNTVSTNAVGNGSTILTFDPSAAAGLAYVR